MHHLLRKKITLLLVVLLAATTTRAQEIELHRADHDNWPYYFGMTLAYNTSSLSVTKNPRFLQNDSVMSVEPGATGGIALGLLGTLKINDFFEFRANPQLIIGGQRYFTYTTKYPEATERKTLPTTIVSFPFHFKLNSDRLGNFRTYMLAGCKFDMDLASNSSARNAEDMVKLKKNDFALDIGFGFNFYLPFVTVSPEIKYSYGLTNLHSRDASLKYSSIMDKLQSRMITFSLHLED
jgi:hypothetical protein